MNKKQVVEKITGGGLVAKKDAGAGHALVNIALCKYWGKRNEELNLPVTSSLSVALPGLEARTEIRASDVNRFSVNGEAVDPGDKSAQRVFEYLGLFSEGCFEVDTVSTVPLAAGLASSASGFAALAKAADDLFDLNLPEKDLSILARLGSGSASRSVCDGFAEWHAGTSDDGMDSFAVRLGYEWPDLRVGLVLLSRGKKPVGSREAMKRTFETSVLYRSWPQKVEEDLAAIRAAIAEQDFERLGRHVESNALGMHATMMETWPPVIYWLPESLNTIMQVHALRAEGVPVYLTMDAGPNVKLIFPAECSSKIQETFADVQIICPFL